MILLVPTLRRKKWRRKNRFESRARSYILSWYPYTRSTCGIAHRLKSVHMTSTSFLNNSSQIMCMPRLTLASLVTSYRNSSHGPQIDDVNNINFCKQDAIFITSAWGQCGQLSVLYNNQSSMHKRSVYIPKFQKGLGVRDRPPQLSQSGEILSSQVTI